MTNGGVELLRDGPAFYQPNFHHPYSSFRPVPEDSMLACSAMNRNEQARSKGVDL
jgi:hypothetical protein